MEIKTPRVAVDGIVKLFGEDGKFKGIVLVDRKYHPHGLALPGGFVDIGEKVEDALVREMREETSLNVKIESIHGVYSDPERDPRFHTVSIVFVCSAVGSPKGGDDAKEARVYKLEDIPFERIVFDHGKILQDYLKKI
ncbi:MAG: NUDIX hydrolase [Hydrogenothermaceae bacterium]|nr:NUDIX hydrolase [Hydrogenothermaceae bacterium]